MCLSSTQFVLKWNKRQRAYVGEGWKNDEVCTLENIQKRYPLNKWIECKFQYNGRPRSRSSMAGLKYHPGFHIFPDREDAKLYQSYGKTYKTLYKEVLAFGPNWTEEDDRPCVIARYMKRVSNPE